ncbi:PepSY domain-containing protein [Actinoplanes sp. NPDC049668]|uniref:PepSY domain-containing protein n=1 Tax=unclassified Actinoplanes TaxID=2626549 RepID=UPI0033BB553F
MITLRTVSTLAAGVAAALALGGTALAASGADDPSGSDDRGGAVEMLPNGDPVPTESATDPAPTATAATSTPEAVPPAAIDIATARAIALKATGGGRVTSIEAETEHGRAVWDIDVVTNGVRHDLDVDRSTGAILRHRTKSSNGSSSSSSSDRRGGHGSDDTGADDRGRGRGSDDSGSDDHGRGGHGSDDSGSDDHGRGGHGSDDSGSDDHGSGGHGSDD